ncbi:ABC transporter permease [Flexithrix dorotheae]|uniref:ABC transporter permease n=1 Tax=Flexithrix dorotheae TaxID=70993 RepID=UPI00037A14F5|nr:ABC transporter permease [Flexithrix dorotheae]
MLKNLLKIALRNILRNKSHTAINLAGLALGITACIIIFLLTSFLLSYNTHHENYDRIYRVLNESKKGGNPDYTPGVPLPLPAAMELEFPEIEEVNFISYKRSGKISIIEDGEEKLIEERGRMAYTLPNYFKVFTRKILYGNTENLLGEPNSIVLSKKSALKYFGKENAVGEILKLDKKYDLKVTGVMEDFPNNSDFPFDLLISFSTVRQDREMEEWGSVWSGDQCYILLPENYDPVNINNRFPQFVKKYYKDHQYKEETHYLQPLSELHFNENFSNFNYNTVSKGSIYGLIIIGLFLLITSSINFINLNTALAARRSKEVGVRKVLGSSRLLLRFQFLAETGIITFIALVFSMGFAELLLIQLNDFLGLSLSISTAFSFELFFFLTLLWLGITLLSGLYPAQIISGFNPSAALKNGITSTQIGGLSVRQSLVIFQFIISQFFIMGTLIVREQMQLLKETHIGFDQEALVKVSLPEKDIEKAKILKSNLLQYQDIQKATLAYTQPASGTQSANSFEFKENQIKGMVEAKFGDIDYLATYNIPLIAGENLLPSDTVSSCLVNEKFVRLIGLKSPEEAIGKFVDFGGEIPIRGVVKDFHTTSLLEAKEPLLITSEGSQYQMIGIKLKSRDMLGTMESIEKEWKKLYPGETFHYSFLDDDIAGFYEGEEKMMAILNVVAFIAIFIGMLGLFGLISYLTELKTKEIGIRKVLGASLMGILILLTKGYSKLIIIAFCISIPLAYFGFSKWLDNYPYKIDLSIGIFLLGGLITFLIAGLTSGFKTIKAAIVNPVDSLRSE